MEETTLEVQETGLTDALDALEDHSPQVAEELAVAET